MNLRRNNAKLAAAGLLAAIVVGGGASIAAAAGPSSSTATTDQQQSDGEHADGPDGGAGSAQETQDPTFTGTVPAPAEQSTGQENSGSDGQEQATLQKLATVSRAQAEQAALGAVPGSVAETNLDAENGFVVYTVEVNGASGNVTEVVIDAGNGTILAQQAQDAGDPADAADQPGQAGDPQD